MLRTIYRALLIIKARATAEQTVRYLSKKQLNDIGHTEWSFVEGSVNSVIHNFDNAKSQRKCDAISYPSKLNLLNTQIKKAVYFNRRKDA